VTMTTVPPRIIKTRKPPKSVDAVKCSRWIWMCVPLIGEFQCFVRCFKCRYMTDEMTIYQHQLHSVITDVYTFNRQFTCIFFHIHFTTEESWKSWVWNSSSNNTNNSVNNTALFVKSADLTNVQYNRTCSAIYRSQYDTKYTFKLLKH